MSIKLTSIIQDVRDPIFYQNPYPFYEEWRCDSPIFFWENYGHWTFTRHVHVEQILQDRRFGRALNGCPLTNPATSDVNLEAFFTADRYSLLNLEPPDHSRLRRLVNRSFTSSVALKMKPQIKDIAEKLCHQLREKFEQGEEVDLLADYAAPLPIRVIASMLEIGDHMHPQLLRWSHAMIRMYEPSRTREVESQAAEASAEFIQYLDDLIAIRRKSLGQDLLSQLIIASEQQDKLTDGEIVSTIILLLNAGHEATVHVIANTSVALLQDDRARGMWLSRMHDPDHAESAINEFLRIDTPLHMFNRYALTDVSIGDLQLKRGDIVSLLLASANRDEDIFENPSAFDLDRNVNSQVSFGRGTHFCLGAPLAKVEVSVALATLFAHFPMMKLQEIPIRCDTYHFHMFEQVIVAAQ